MSNIFNDLNKLVNTVQKVDKLLTEKPKRTRTKSVSLTEDELNRIMQWFLQCDEELSKMVDYRSHHRLYEKIKQNWREIKTK
jgi:predicted component of type VI protein secretion system